MNKFQNISTLISGIAILIVGVMQVFSNLYGSGCLMFTSGIIILILRSELKEKKDE